MHEHQITSRRLPLHPPHSRSHGVESIQLALRSDRPRCVGPKCAGACSTAFHGAQDQPNPAQPKVSTDRFHSDPGGTKAGRRRDESGTGPILLNWAAPPTSERSSPGRGILISAYLSRASRRTIGRLKAQTFRDFLLPFRLAKGAASLHAPAKRFQFLHVVALIDPLEPIRWHIDRPRRQQRPLFSRGRKLGRD